MADQLIIKNGDNMQKAQAVDLQVGAIVWHKDAPNKFTKSKITRVFPDDDEYVVATHVNANNHEIGYGPFSAEVSTFYIHNGAEDNADVEMAAGRKKKRKTRRRAHKKRKTLSKRK